MECTIGKKKREGIRLISRRRWGISVFPLDTPLSGDARLHGRGNKPRSNTPSRKERYWRVSRGNRLFRVEENGYLITMRRNANQTEI